ncbi:hypothetical protein FHX77_001151 [Bifidobacterium commune]|nr:hypothetical protein [Bifidobacterium commune]
MIDSVYVMLLQQAILEPSHPNQTSKYVSR